MVALSNPHFSLSDDDGNKGEDALVHMLTGDSRVGRVIGRAFCAGWIEDMGAFFEVEFARERPPVVIAAATDLSIQITASIIAAAIEPKGADEAVEIFIKRTRRMMADHIGRAHAMRAAAQ